MINKAGKTVALVLLTLMPYSMALSPFSPYDTSHSFGEFLVASLVFAGISFLLGFAVTGRKLPENKAFAFFLLGMVVAPPLTIGIPETSPRLLERVAEEHFRYGLLFLAALIFVIGFVRLLKWKWDYLSRFHKAILIPFGVSVLLLLWDAASSYNFSSELKDWIAKGQKAEDFFPDYNFRELLRTFGRSLIYVITPWLSYILFSLGQLKKWQLLVQCLFCALGILFFFLFNFVDTQFYFPFMIPAVAFAPVYWLGLMLISRNDP